MDLRDKKILILGGWGLVGSAIARVLVSEEPAEIVIHSLYPGEAEEAVRSISGAFPHTRTRFAPAWGNVFVREDLKDHDRSRLLKDGETRRAIIQDTMYELSD